MDLSAIKSDESLMRAALEQAGVKRWTGAERRQCKCCFHDDRHPSAGMHRSRDGGCILYTCNGCGVTGDVFHIIALSRNVSDGDVLRHLNETGELLGGLRVTEVRPGKLKERPVEPPYEKFAAEVAKWRGEADRTWLTGMADGLGVTASALRSLGCGHNADLKCATFPMFDAQGRISGIRYRWPDGEKKARTGSWSGLFLPSERAGKVLWVCEGPTDTAALLSLGLWAIGLPAAKQGVDLVDAYVEKHAPAALIAMSDDNAVGKASATLVARAVSGRVAGAKTLLPPGGAKDIRAFVKGRREAGKDWPEIRRELLAALAASKPVRPKTAA